MEIFRISRKEYSDKLYASGSANRWNRDGEKVIYAGSSRSLAALELIVHRGAVKPNFNYKVLVISADDKDEIVKQVFVNSLPKNWRKMSAYPDLQKIGSDWYRSKETLLLKVPSSVIPMEYNYLINTQHQNFNSYIKLVRVEDYFWDERLL
ncbi:MAG: RES family NAD+ phosphorylase [Calditrichaceae bacterium]|jgi:RES domain-containing protein